MNIPYRLKELLSKQQMWEMANIEQEDTGLSVIVYVSPKNANHGPRIKFVNSYSKRYDGSKTIPMSIEDSPKILTKFKPEISNKDIELIKKWVVLNKQVLLDYLNFEITTKQMINSIQKV